MKQKQQKPQLLRLADERDYFTPPQLARLAQVSSDTIRRFIDEGIIPGHRRGGKRYIILKSDLPLIKKVFPYMRLPNREVSNAAA